MPTALVPTKMLILTLLERCHQSPATKPHIFLRRLQPTANPQGPLVCCDLNGRQRPPWCPTPDANAENVAQNVGGLSYVAAPVVGHHGGRGKTAATMVGGAWFI
jgi:hypothetical protein